MATPRPPILPPPFVLSSYPRSLDNRILFRAARGARAPPRFTCRLLRQPRPRGAGRACPGTQRTQLAQPAGAWQARSTRERRPRTRIARPLQSHVFCSLPGQRLFLSSSEFADAARSPMIGQWPAYPPAANAHPAGAFCRCSPPATSVCVHSGSVVALRLAQLSRAHQEARASRSDCPGSHAGAPSLGPAALPPRSELNPKPARSTAVSYSPRTLLAFRIGKPFVRRKREISGSSFRIFFLY